MRGAQLGGGALGYGTPPHGIGDTQCGGGGVTCPECVGLSIGGVVLGCGVAPLGSVTHWDAGVTCTECMGLSLGQGARLWRVCPPRISDTVGCGGYMY